MITIVKLQQDNKEKISENTAFSIGKLQSGTKCFRDSSKLNL